MIATLIAGLVSGETMSSLRRAKSAAIAYGIAAVLLVIGAGFLVGAFYIWLSRTIGPLEAAAAIGGGFVAVGLVVILVHTLTAKRRARIERERRRADLAAMGVTTGLAVLPTLLRGKKGIGAAAAPMVLAAAYGAYVWWRGEKDPGKAEARTRRRRRRA